MRGTIAGMKLYLVHVVVVVCLVSGTSLTTQTTTQQQQQSEREREAQQQREEQMRREEMRQREEERRRQEEERLRIEQAKKEFGELKIDPRESLALREKMRPAFIRSIAKLNEVSAELAAFVHPGRPEMQLPVKEVRKKAGSIEDTAADLMKFILFMETSPAAPSVNYHEDTIESRTEILAKLTRSVVPKLQLYLESERRGVLDVNLVAVVVRELQLVQIVGKSLKSLQPGRS